jgi:hypothetical protein
MVISEEKIEERRKLLQKFLDTIRISADIEVIMMNFETRSR